MIWIWVAVIGAIVFIVISISHVHLKVSYKRYGENDRFTVFVKALYGMVRLRFEMPEILFKGLKGVETQSEMINERKHKVMTEKEQMLNVHKMLSRMKQVRNILRHTADLLQWLRTTLKHVKCTMLQWHTKIGRTEAHITAIAVGAVWAIKAPLVGWITQLINLQTTPDLVVQPKYNNNFFSTEALCIVKIRLGYAMFAGILLIFRIVKAKGGIQTWKNTLFKA